MTSAVVLVGLVEMKAEECGEEVRARFEGGEGDDIRKNEAIQKLLTADSPNQRCAPNVDQICRLLPRHQSS